MSYPCGNCTSTVPHVDLLYRVDWNESLVCGACKYEKQVASARASSEAAAASVALAVKGTWESEQGKLLKAERNALLDANRWTVMPDSPLTATSQADWLRYLKALQNLTVTYPTLASFKGTDGKWKWPAKPALKYELLSVSATVNVGVNVK